MGADAVIASHPHVPQGWEYYKGKLICYSLGNFCFQKRVKKLPKHWNESLCCVIEGERGNGYKVLMRPVLYQDDTQYICDNLSDEFKKHIDELNSVMQNQVSYMKKVNVCVSGLLDHYMGLFSRSGWLAKINSKETLKGIVERFDKKHAFNNISCESHRWAIIRALKLKYNV